MHVLIGTYELLGLTNLSAQLSRRSVEIHCGRYCATLDKDRLAFKSVLLTFQRHLPVSEEPDLVGLWERLYEGSLGCVGVLKSWLNRALADAIAHEATTITRRHLDRQALPTRTLLNLAREITEGEAILREDPKGRDQLRSLVGLPTTSMSCQPSLGTPQWQLRKLPAGGHEISPAAATRPSHWINGVRSSTSFRMAAVVVGEWGHVGNSAGVVQAWREPGGMSHGARSGGMAERHHALAGCRLSQSD
jgi:hypothetical protein